MTVLRNLARTGWSGWRLSGAMVVMALCAVVTSAAWIDLARLTLTARGLIYLPLMMLIVGWLVWVRRQRLRYCRPGGSLIGPPIVLGGWLLYSFAATSGAPLVFYLGAWLVMIGGALSVCREMVRQFMPAVVALAFLLPVVSLEQNTWSGPLQAIVAEVNWTLCYLLGMTGTVSDESVVGYVSRAMAETGHGIQLLLVLCALSYAFVFGQPLRWSVRALILVLTPLVALLCSGVGLAVVVWLLGRITPNVDELWMISQWGILMVAVTALAGLLRLLGWASLPLRVYPLASVDQ